MDSDIRIVQCALRPNRIEKYNPNKKAYIIIPYIDYNNWNNNKSFEKIRKIIGKLRNIDKNIEQKIHVGHILTKQKTEITTINTTTELNINNVLNTKDIYYDENELIKLKLRLIYSKTLDSKYSPEQEEFNYIRQLNKELNIYSKEDYIIKRVQHIMYIPNPEYYFSKKNVWTNWYNFLGYNTTQFIQSKQKWINFCKEHKVSSIHDYENLCKIYKELPRNPNEFYTNFTNIQNELGIYKIRR